MAKKKTQARRIPRATEPRMYGDGKPSQAAQQTGVATPASTATTGSRPLGSRPVTQGRPANLASRTPGVAARVPVTTTLSYDYVLKDLRRLGILAAAFFIVLIGLGLVIR